MTDRKVATKRIPRHAMPFALSERDSAYVAALTAILESGLAPTLMIGKLLPIVEQHRTVPINGLIRAVVTDIECHLGIYKSAELDFVPIDPELTFEQGLKTLAGALKDVLKNIEPPQLYRRFIRWIQWEDERLEVTEMGQVDFHFSLVKSVSSEDFFFFVWKNNSAAYWQVLIKVPPEHRSRVTAAAKKGDLIALGKIADHLSVGP